ncbi:hypothetical protein HYH02_005004 [Chlamydomonas schloesseri]|uniref:holo-[acyl-carrier-protein] synthase n=1 Tax=Chlamydomonas schloesseri TaxID=2026947 RepID=A0A836B8C5_9CHLO|nr:hypothetical protein HYH02_005004 [Chlamydomonas schloesseri]|eukprot:KAG2450503.1 hypothetical protein HYH02_005004 [Chlamydomonas schloesseri]
MAGAGLFQRHLALLPHEEQQQVLEFLQPADQFRALASRIMQRCAVVAALGVAWREVALGRTKGRKPFTTNAKPPHAPNFNFNVSHEGRYVVLAAEPLALVGVDVAAPRSARPGPAAARPLEQHLQLFRPQLSDSEWAMLEGLAGSAEQQESAFQSLWCLKEAFIKARGDGLGFSPLSRAAFELQPPNAAAAAPSGDEESQSLMPVVAAAAAAAPASGIHSTLKYAKLVLDGVRQPRWRFQLHMLPGGHCAAVALGPAAEAVDEWGVFTATLGLPGYAPDPYPDPDNTIAASPTFQVTSLRELLVQAEAAEL